MNLSLMCIVPSRCFQPTRFAMSKDARGDHQDIVFDFHISVHLWATMASDRGSGLQNIGLLMVEGRKRGRRGTS